MDYGIDAAHGLANRDGVGEIPERDLDADPIRPQAARIPNEAANVLTRIEQPLQQSGADQTGGSGEQNHVRSPLSEEPCILRNRPSIRKNMQLWAAARSGGESNRKGRR
jgi:hypothetical protein